MTIGPHVTDAAAPAECDDAEPGAAELRMVVILYTGVASSCCSKQPSSSSSSSSTESALRAMFTARDIIRGAAARAAAPRAAEE